MSEEKPAHICKFFPIIFVKDNKANTTAKKSQNMSVLLSPIIHIFCKMLRDNKANTTAKESQNILERVAIAVQKIAPTVILVDLVPAAEHGLEH